MKTIMKTTMTVTRLEQAIAETEKALEKGKALVKKYTEKKG